MHILFRGHRYEIDRYFVQDDSFTASRITADGQIQRVVFNSVERLWNDHLTIPEETLEWFRQEEEMAQRIREEQAQLQAAAQVYQQVQADPVGFRIRFDHALGRPPRVADPEDHANTIDVDFSD